MSKTLVIAATLSALFSAISPAAAAGPSEAKVREAASDFAIKVGEPLCKLASAMNAFYASHRSKDYLSAAAAFDDQFQRVLSDIEEWGLSVRGYAWTLGEDLNAPTTTHIADEVEFMALTAKYALEEARRLTESWIGSNVERRSRSYVMWNMLNAQALIFKLAEDAPASGCLTRPIAEEIIRPVPALTEFIAENLTNVQHHEAEAMTSRAVARLFGPAD